MKKTILLFSTLILFLGFPLFSQEETKQEQTKESGILKGKVTDVVFGEPILFGTVAVFQKDVLITGTETDLDGNFKFTGIVPGVYTLEVSYIGYQTLRTEPFEIKSGETKVMNLQIWEGTLMNEIVVTGRKEPLIDFDNTSTTITVSGKRYKKSKSTKKAKKTKSNKNSQKTQLPNSNNRNQFNTEDYDLIVENTFHDPKDEPLSTLSIDIDRAAYSNVRRFLNNGTLPPLDAVRIEELINYFDYKYETPKNSDPFAMHPSVIECPWNKNHNLLHVAIQGQKLDTEELPNSNIVFLIDVSGSMNSANKLDLVKSSIKLLVENLRAEDRVAMVVYAGSAGLVLDSTPGDNKELIIDALDQLSAGGSTAGGAGIKLAYKIAKENFLENGNNRVILATDGDFNVGASSDSEMVRLIKSYKDDDIFLSVLGYGMGNYKDNKMQKIANDGNGNHAYIDNLEEAKKILINEFSSTLYTIAKDVKIQIEFNPNEVNGYRLIGYENRLLDKEDFNDDTKDAGELGVGHVVTAIYEIIPKKIESEYVANVDKLKYQRTAKRILNISKDLGTIKMRYKLPKGKESIKLEKEIQSSKAQEVNLEAQFASSVALFGMLLRRSEFIQNGTFDDVIELAESAKGEDAFGYRSEFIELVKISKEISESLTSNTGH